MHRHRGTTGRDRALSGFGGVRLRYVLLGTIVFNTLIAGFITALGLGPFLPNLWLSQFVGLSICAVLVPLLQIDFPGRYIPFLLVGGIITAVLLGRRLASWSAAAAGLPMPLAGGTAEDLRVILFGLVFGGIASFFFYNREVVGEMRQSLRDEQLRHLQAEKAQVAMELRLLQAQTEPHFLFNTLAHVQALLEHDPPRAGEMLRHLNDYLRRSLQHARAERTTLRDEFELLRAYLAILRIRMGQRLCVDIQLPPALADREIPPMLLQPLVENAVKHGLEPKIDGGALWLSARDENAALVLEVADSGLGLNPASGGSGVGLANLRERLAGLYGGAARLDLEDRPGGGVLARVRLPRSAS